MLMRHLSYCRQIVIPLGALQIHHVAVCFNICQPIILTFVNFFLLQRFVFPLRKRFFLYYSHTLIKVTAMAKSTIILNLDQLTDAALIGPEVSSAY